MEHWSKAVTSSKGAKDLLARKALGYRYAVGQPMGAYSSWAMLAITHHCLVQFAFRRCGGKGWFRDYAVLGDDIVIASDAVASQYRMIMNEIGVDISLAKSLIASGKTLEFAKRVYFNGEDVSGLPWNLWSVSQQNVSTAVAVVARLTGQGVKLSCSSLSMAYGASWRAASRVGNAWKVMSKRLQIMFVAMTHPNSGSPWARGNWLDWLCQDGPSLGVQVVTESSWFTPWGTALQSEFLRTWSDRIEVLIREYFFDRYERSPQSIRDWVDESMAPTGAHLNAQWNRKLLKAQESIEKSQKTIQHLTSLNVSFNPRQNSAIFSQIVSSVETSMAQIPKVSDELVFERTDKVRFPASDLYKLWERWRERAGRPRSRPAGGIRPSLAPSVSGEDRIVLAGEGVAPWDVNPKLRKLFPNKEWQAPWKI